MEDVANKAMEEIKGLTKETRIYLVREFADICQKFMSAIEGKDVEALKDELWRVSAQVRRVMP